MARITPLEGHRAPLWLRLMNRASRRVMGQEVTPLKIVAYNPRFLLGCLGTTLLVNGKTRPYGRCADQRIINRCAVHYRARMVRLVGPDDVTPASAYEMRCP